MNSGKIIFILLMLQAFFGSAIYGQEKIFRFETDTLYFDTFDEPPHFPGGKDSLNKFIAENFIYHAHICAEGTIWVRLFIDKQGNIVKAKIIKGIQEMYNNEALRVVSKMPQWKPANINGRNIPSKIDIPVRIKISE